MRFILVGLLILNLSSCATKPVEISYNCPKLVLPKDPILYTKKLTEKSNAEDVMKSWVATAVAYRDWNKTVRKQVAS
jgi:hypothetical protein